MSTAPDALLERWRRFRSSRNTALAADYGWLTLTSFQWLESQPSAVDLAPGLWSTDGTTAALTAAAADGLTLVEPGEPVDGTITAQLADEESLMWVQFGGEDGRQVVVELAMRAESMPSAPGIRSRRCSPSSTACPPLITARTWWLRHGLRRLPSRRTFRLRPRTRWWTACTGASASWCSGCPGRTTSTGFTPRRRSSAP